MPLPSTRVIHAQFSAHHAPVAQGTMTATCRIVRPVTGTTWDSVTESTIPNPPTVVAPSGTVCRVQEFMRATSGSQAGQVVTERRYLVPVPAGTAPVDVKDHVIIEGCPADASLVGRTLYVEDVQWGSERFQRDLVCTTTMA